MSWIVEEVFERQFNEESIAAGNKFLIGNGYYGYRGTAEEFTKEQLTAFIVGGLYDQVGSSWRELINAPNPLYTAVYFNDVPISLLSTEIITHKLQLDILSGVLYRHTEFRLADDVRITIRSERFASVSHHHLLAMKYEIQCSHSGKLKVVTGIDGDVWDINGPHLQHIQHSMQQDTVSQLASKTYEQQKLVVVSEAIASKHQFSEVKQQDLQFIRELELNCESNQLVQFYKLTTLYSSLDSSDEQALLALSGEMTKFLQEQGYKQHKELHRNVWRQRWEKARISIVGNREDQLALNYSLYQLMIAAPYHSEKLSIPARALSGQVYKGAVFWDTEIFMLPFFLYTDPGLAKNLLMYRVYTLAGAKRKAAEYGYRGAFYAWESQDTGDDACTLFNVTDVFTGRPMRTYFRDKQIHISADVAYAILQYVRVTQDDSILLEGGAEVIIECARFICSYAYYQPHQDRYVLLDVTGPDEYHERVHNNAFTNYLAAHVLQEAVKLIEHLKINNEEQYDRLIKGQGLEEEVELVRSIAEKLYLPLPNDKGVIEQFDHYFSLEEVELAELKERMLHPHEYLGGGNGLATTTQIIKQADVVLMLHLFADKFNQDIIRSNWDYYEPRTEHGSSLSPCVYAIVAARLGYTDYAYHYFRRTSTIDLTGKSKLYVGNLYIGGTHPAANGGAWMAAIYGFAGFSYREGTAVISPKLPKQWKSIMFNIIVEQQHYEITITHADIHIEPAKFNTKQVSFLLKTEAGLTSKMEL